MGDDDIDQFRNPEEQIIRVPQKDSQPVRGEKRVISIGMTRYFRSARERLDYLEYGDPSDYLLRKLGRVFPRSSLQKVWVPPTFRGQDDSGSELSLQSVLNDQNKCILLLADAGVGKSTISRYLTCKFIEGYESGTSEYFALYIPLKTLRFSKNGEPLDYKRIIADCAARFVGLETEDVIDDIEASLADAVLIFDGLDELPISRTTQVRGLSAAAPRLDAVEMIRLLSAQSITLEDRRPIPFRSFVTSRFRDYMDNPSSHLSGASIYTIGRFSPTQMQEAVSKWHAAACIILSHYDPAAPFLRELRERPLAIMGAQKANADLGQVCLTPLMLSILQTVHSGGQDLPSSVSQLCERAVDWLMIAKHAATQDAAFIQQHSGWLLDTIAELGWEVHNRTVEGLDRSIDDDDIRRIAKSLRTVGSGASADDDFDVKEAEITRICSHLRRGHGILVPVASGKFDFAHTVFREVLAGLWLGRQPVTNRIKYALNAAWHGPLRYWAGLLAPKETGQYEISALFGELEQCAEQGDVLAIIAQAEMVAEVCAVASGPKLTRDIIRRIAHAREALTGLLGQSGLSFPFRLRVGDLLALLGDPRLEPSILDRTCEIEGAEVIIGRNSKHSTRLRKYDSCPVAPPIRGFLKSFKIGQYLVTNSEFQQFIACDGYKVERYWPNETAWKWASGDELVLDALVQNAGKAAQTHFSSELAGNRLDPNDIPERCKRMIERRLPMYWYDPTLNRPNQPVVGINFWEACAYCAWLTERLHSDSSLEPHKIIRLPVEAEWEAAARACGNGGVYPWKSGEPASNAHVRVTNPDAAGLRALRSSAVGLFRFVETNKPIYDLIGNAWELTASKAEPYSERSFDQRIDLHGEFDRIARGSSWLSSERESAEVTFRSFDPPYNAYEDLGFRIVVGDSR